jgi:SAM-dependent methyltransferase
MGASQFRLLCALGLREYHDLLDFGCGSLRAGRLFIPYLRRGKYSGIEPNAWLIEDAIRQEIGADLVTLKAPKFSYDDTFSCKKFLDESFDYVLAQSVFSHTGRDLTTRLLDSFRRVLKPEGLLVCTFIHPRGRDEYFENGWVYPKCVRYKDDTVSKFMLNAGFFHQQLPWYHPRQIWYIASKSINKIIPSEKLHKLCGSVFFDPVFEESLK